MRSKKRRKKRINGAALVAALFFAAALLYYAAQSVPQLQRLFPFFGRKGTPAVYTQLSDVPPYSGSPYTDINGNVPFFTADDMDRALSAAPFFEIYEELDGLGRCGSAFACVGPESLPQEEREEIGSVYPTGWHSVQYEGIDRGYLYNRCHLIGFQLTGQNANERNLITGTRYLNMEGMRPFEDSVAQYVRGTGRHVLYRVTPVFHGSDLLASGVLMEARSVEDPVVEFCVYCYNVQPGIRINYATGSSEKAEGTEPSAREDGRGADGISEGDYIVNVSSMKFHRPDCEAAAEISGRNRQIFEGTREELVRSGYSPCGICCP